MEENLNGQTAIVTGGAGGYGKGIAAALKERGARVWIADVDEEALARTAAELDVHAVRTDVASAADWDALLAAVLAESPCIDILVNNVGAGIRIAPLDEWSDEDIRKAIDVNLLSTALGCARVAGRMKRQKRGTIVNISSVCERWAWPGYAVYSAAKAGVGQLSKCLYAELRESGVRVTNLIPSWGATEWSPAAGLDRRSDEDNAKCIQPQEMGEFVATICGLPPHLELQELVLWPLAQEVVPL